MFRKRLRYLVALSFGSLWAHICFQPESNDDAIVISNFTRACTCLQYSTLCPLSPFLRSIFYWLRFDIGIPVSKIMSNITFWGTKNKEDKQTMRCVVNPIRYVDIMYNILSQNWYPRSAQRLVIPDNNIETMILPYNLKYRKEKKRGWNWKTWWRWG